MRLIQSTLRSSLLAIAILSATLTLSIAHAQMDMDADSGAGAPADAPAASDIYSVEIKAGVMCKPATAVYRPGSGQCYAHLDCIDINHNASNVINAICSPNFKNCKRDSGGNLVNCEQPGDECPDIKTCNSRPATPMYKDAGPGWGTKPAHKATGQKIKGIQ